MPSEAKKDASAPSSPVSKATKKPNKEEQAAKPRSLKVLLRESIATLERAVEQKDDRRLRSFVRRIVIFRKQLGNEDLGEAIRNHLPEGTPNRDFVLAALAKLPADVVQPSDTSDGGVVDAMDIDISETTDEKTKEEKPSAALPEVEIFFHLLVLSRSIAAARKSSEHLPLCVESASLLLARLRSFSRHTLDLIGSKVYIMYSLVHELSGRDAFASIRPELFRAYRTSCLRRDDMGRATLVNLLLRNFITFNMYEQAGKLLDSIPEQYPAAVSNNQFVRHLYYVGRVHAVNCEYGEAHQRLSVVSFQARAHASLRLVASHFSSPRVA